MGSVSRMTRSKASFEPVFSTTMAKVTRSPASTPVRSVVIGADASAALVIVPVNAAAPPAPGSAKVTPARDREDSLVLAVVASVATAPLVSVSVGTDTWICAMREMSGRLLSVLFSATVALLVSSRPSAKGRSVAVKVYSRSIT